MPKEKIGPDEEAKLMERMRQLEEDKDDRMNRALANFRSYPKPVKSHEDELLGSGFIWGVMIILGVLMLGIYIGWFTCKAFGNANDAAMRVQKGYSVESE